MILLECFVCFDRFSDWIFVLHQNNGPITLKFSLKFTNSSWNGFHQFPFHIMRFDEKLFINSWILFLTLQGMNTFFGLFRFGTLYQSKYKTNNECMVRRVEKNMHMSYIEMRVVAWGCFSNQSLAYELPEDVCFHFMDIQKSPCLMLLWQILYVWVEKNLLVDNQCCQLHTVAIMDFFCHSDFTWNQSWRIQGLKIWYFDTFGCSEFWF